MCSSHVHNEGTVLGVEFEALVHLIASKAFQRSQGIYTPLSRRVDIDPPAVGAFRRPGEAIAKTETLDHHVLVVDACAFQQFVLEFGVVGWFVVAVGYPRGEGDVGLVGIVVNQKMKGAWHVVGAESHGTPGMGPVDSQSEVELILVFLEDGEAKTDGAIGVDEYGVVGVIIVALLGKCGRDEYCWSSMLAFRRRRRR